MFRLGLAASLLAVAFHIAQTVLFYEMFKPVGRSTALLFAFSGLVAIALQAVSSLFQLPALPILGGVGGLGAPSLEQLQSLAFIFLRLIAQAFNVYLVSFGLRCAAIGNLICKSIILPGMIGVLMPLA